jgi:hypothetical protein
MPKNISAEALYNACRSGDAAALRRLLPAGGTPRNLSGPPFQARATSKRTPLMVAAAFGHTEIVRMLLERAPNTPVDYVDANGGTALAATAQFHHADILRLLADRCASSVNVADQWRETPLHLAVGEINGPPRDPDPEGAQQLATVRVLLRLGAGTLRFPASPSQPPRPRGTFFEITFLPKHLSATHVMSV